MTAAELTKARATVRDDKLWMEADPAFAIVLRFPSASPADLAELIADADALVAAELGPAEPIEQPAIEQAKQRAEAILARTQDYEALGLGDLAAATRSMASDYVDLTHQLDAEHSARVALQQSRDRCLEILAARAGAAMEAAAGGR